MARHVVILAGGSGTRLWPRSREKSPKHLLRLHGQQSLLQSTLERVSRLTENV
jgi:mannose-1-phosphate guanylyltransferase/mannose-6-phosphate isomerase